MARGGGGRWNGQTEFAASGARRAKPMSGTGSPTSRTRRWCREDVKTNSSDAAMSVVKTIAGIPHKNSREDSTELKQPKAPAVRVVTRTLATCLRDGRLPCQNVQEATQPVSSRKHLQTQPLAGAKLESSKGCVLSATLSSLWREESEVAYE